MLPTVCLPSLNTSEIRNFDLYAFTHIGNLEVELVSIYFELD